jgi:hypothetical protein
MFFNTGETLLGEIVVTFVGSFLMVTDREETFYPLTLTVIVRDVEARPVVKPEVRQISLVDESETISHLEPSLKVIAI